MKEISLHLCLLSLILGLLLLTGGSQAWNNGLARTPPMGWMSWLKYACNIDCVRYPAECINDRLYRDMVDRLAEDGYAELGYNTVNIDDCWSAMERDPGTKRLVPDPGRFPNGIKSLAEYAHSKNIFFGIYEDVGTKTCGGYPGTRTNGTDYTQIDAETFSDWGIDSLKLDGCYADEAKYNETYPEYTKALAQVQHKIVYACSWPAYLIDKMTTQDYEQIQANCNYWRNFDDIMDSWQSVVSIIAFYRKHVKTFVQYHGPGGWFDADMLIIGNDGLSVEQAKAQMAFWSLWSVPLLMSNDLRTIKPEFSRILKNRHLISVNQDSLGIMGHVVTSAHSLDTWVKKLTPLPSSGLNPWVVLYFNNQQLGVPTYMSHKLLDLIPELKPDLEYNVHDLFDENRIVDTLTPAKNLTLKVPTSGAVRIVKLVPVASVMPSLFDA